MKTGAEDDSRSTPTLAFSGSSACAVAPAPRASQPASATRAHPFMRIPPSRLQALRDRLVAPDESALLLQRLLQPVYRNVARKSITRKRKCGGRAGGLPHRETGAGDARRRLALMGHRGA